MIPVLLSLLALVLTIGFVYSDINRISTLYVTLGSLSVFIWMFVRARDPYGLFHLSLNKLPNEDPDASPRTEWLNMGYWKNTVSFPEACEALALKLVQAAGCKAGGKVLDVGHGSGESLILLLSHPSVPPPSSLTGITSLLAHSQRSQDRVTRLQSSQHGPRTKVSLYHGDAIYRPPSLYHPLDPSSTSSFDTILALDCAYHFNTRHTFLSQSLNRLAPGGRIALADICFSRTALQSRRMRFIMSLIRMMPRDNMISAEQYIQDMRKNGYVGVELDDVTADVFPGFTKFLASRGVGWSMFAKLIRGLAGLGMRFVIVSGAKADV